jgi:hypothetical protein
MKSVSNSGASDSLKITRFPDFCAPAIGGAEKRVYKEELCHH